MTSTRLFWLSYGIWAGLIWTGLSSCAPVSHDPPALAVVNGRPITQDEFQYRWSELSESSRHRYAGQGGRKKFLEDLTSREILLQEARRLGLDQSQDMRERLERHKEQLMLEDLMKDVVAMNITVSDAELQAYYDTHRAVMLSALNVRAAHIVLPTE